MKSVVSIEDIGRRIHEVRGVRVMLDADFAELYGVDTRSLVQAAKRNKDRFPSDFMFVLTREEVTLLRSQIMISNTDGRGRKSFVEKAVRNVRWRS